MKTTSGSVRTFGLALLAGLLAATTGCQSIGKNQTTAGFVVEPGQMTRDRLYREVGPPHAVFERRDGREVLVYNHMRIRGMTVGASVMYSPVRIGSSKSSMDSVFVDMSRDDIVVGVRQYGGEASPGWSLWPGGEGSAD